MPFGDLTIQELKTKRDTIEAAIRNKVETEAE